MTIKRSSLNLDSTSYVTTAEGNVSQYIAYMPFGDVFYEQHSSSEQMPYKFNAKELDSETGLYYYGARYYDPSISLWLSVDPLAEKYPGMSPYAYTFNNPVRFTDPDGMAPADIIIQILSAKTFKNTNSTLVSRKVAVTMTLTIVNLAGADLSKTKYDKESGEIRISQFEGRAENRHNEGAYNTVDNIESFKVDYKVVNSINDIREGDHVLLIVNEIKGDRNIVGLATMDGLVSAVEASTIGKGFDVIAMHEKGHNMKMDHTNEGLMKEQTDGKSSAYGTMVTPKERGAITKQLGIMSKEWTSKKSSRTGKTSSKQEAKDFKTRNIKR